MSSPETAMRVVDQRDFLIALVEEDLGIEVTDKGFYFPADQGDFVYETEGGRFEVTVKEITE